MREGVDIPLKIEDMVRRELEHGEKIVWMEQPIPRYFTPGAIGLVLFAIPWTGFAVFWICAALGFKVPDFSKDVGRVIFALFGLPFVLVGMGMLSAPIWIYRKAFKTIYVITDRRAITLESGWTTTIRSYTPDMLHNIYREEKSNGTGSVILQEEVSTDSDNTTTQTKSLGFLNIRDPKTVEKMLKELAEQDMETHE